MRAVISLPSAKPTRVVAVPGSSPAASAGTLIRAPNLSRLEHGALGEFGAGDAGGEAEVVLDAGRRARPGRRWPSPRPRSCSRPSEAAYTAAASPAGPEPTMRRSPRPSSDGRGGRPMSRASSALLGLRSRVVSRQMTSGVSSGPTREAAQQRLGLLVRLQVDPAVRQPVAGGELAQPPGVGRVARADDAEAGALADEQARGGPDRRAARHRRGWGPRATRSRSRSTGDGRGPRRGPLTTAV